MLNRLVGRTIRIKSATKRRLNFQMSETKIKARMFVSERSITVIISPGSCENMQLYGKISNKQLSGKLRKFSIQWCLWWWYVTESVPDSTQENKGKLAWATHYPGLMQICLKSPGKIRVEYWLGSFGCGRVICGHSGSRLKDLPME